MQNDVWELFNTTEDFSLTNNLADKNPTKLEEIRKLFKKEAIANSVYPLDDRSYERFNAAIAGRPDLMGDRTSLTLSQGMAGILENTFINEKNTSKTIVANVDLKGSDRGVILCQGGKFGGWALYMDQGKPAYTYNWFGLESYTIASPKAIDKKNAEIKLVFDYEGGGTGKGGQATSYVDGEKSPRDASTRPSQRSTRPMKRPMSAKMKQLKWPTKCSKMLRILKFTGRVNKVTISIPKKK